MTFSRIETLRLSPQRSLFTMGLVGALALATPGCGPRSSTGPEEDGSVGEDVSTEECIDLDGDGYGDNCPLGPDCDDTDDTIHPGAEEICGDNVDNNCDGLVDEGCACDPGTWRICSSWSDPLALTPEMHCRAGHQLCVDGNWGSECLGEILPVQETCNGIDDNCDGLVDEGLLNAVGQCSGGVPPEDCGPTGEGNGIDDNGNGEVDEGCSCAVPGDDPDLLRRDQPCYTGPIYTLGVGVCRGGLRSCLVGGTWGPCLGEVLPGPEVCGDGKDNDCDGFVDEGCPGCINPTEEVCDGIDNNCNGIVDEGVRNACGGCGDVPEDEICGDGLDNNCNGQIDEGCDIPCEQDVPCYPGPPETAGVGACHWGTRSCVGGEFWTECTGYVLPSPELCGAAGTGNAIDEDCDGIRDNGCFCQEGAQRYCGSGAGECEYGIQTCQSNAWGPCEGGKGPEPEVCDGLDNDCNGLVDDGLLNACGTCGESCYLLPMDPTTQGTPDDGIAVITAGDPDNPTGKDGITLTSASFIPPYLWAANETHNTVTKYNTNTHTEEGIFWVGSNPSRTAVDLDGNMWVGGRNDGRLTKVLWDVNSCDPMNNGVAGLQTSTGGPATLVNSATNPMADDCVVYSAVPNPSRPSIRGVAAGPDGRLWIGYTGGGVQAIDPHTLLLGTFHSGASGVPVYQPDAVTGVQQPTGATGAADGVYGMVVDAQGVLYISHVNDRTSFSIFDTVTETWVGRMYGLCGAYGIALDGMGRIWHGSYTGCSGVNMYDPTERKLYAFTVPTSVSTTANIHGFTSGVTLLSGNCKAQQVGSSLFQVTGVGVEPATGDVWASHWQLGYTMRLHVDNANYANSTITFIGTCRDPTTGALLSGVGTDLRGVGFDMNGFAWTLGLNSDRVWKLDPATNARHTSLPTGQSIGVGTHYTYSDFTGSTALNFTSPRGFWRYVFVSQFELAQVDAISWDAYVPAQTTAGIRIRVLDQALNPVTGWLPPEVGGAPQYFDYPTGLSTHDEDLSTQGGPLVGWAFEVDLRLTTQDRAVRPIVHDVRLLWQRP